MYRASCIPLHWLFKNDTILILTYNYSRLEPNIKSQLEAIIEKEFGHIPIVAKTEWSVPNWSILIYQENEMAAFVNIVERIIHIDGSAYTVGGINNLITIKEFRGKGYAKKLMQVAKELIYNQLNCNLSVLLCADHLVPFYEKMDWRKVNCPVIYNQTSGEKIWKANTMLHPLGNLGNPPKKINLNGLPW